MCNEPPEEQVLNSLNELLVSKNLNECELLSFGFIPNKCYVPKISMIIHCVENIEIFSDEQKENIINMINHYKYV